MGHFGFSYVGAFYLLLLFTPNFIFIKCQPAGYRELPAKEPLLLLWLEAAVGGGAGRGGVLLDSRPPQQVNPPASVSHC